MVLVGETPRYPRQLLNIFSKKFVGFVVVLFCARHAYVRGLGLHFKCRADDRDELVQKVRQKAARLTKRRIDTAFDKELWRTFYRSQTIAGRKHSNPRWCMPKKLEKHVDIAFEAAEFSRQGNMQLSDFS